MHQDGQRHPSAVNCNKQSTEYELSRQTLIDYLKVKVAEADWHGVSDAANDLRVLEAKEEGAKRNKQ